MIDFGAAWWPAGLKLVSKWVVLAIWENRSLIVKHHFGSVKSNLEFNFKN
jgi:hypothetical protein